jgi:hypothetical protein
MYGRRRVQDMSSKSKQHFSDEQWSDYVRNLTAPGIVVEIQRHLDSGCKECEAAARFWSTFYEVSPHAFEFQPPAEVIRAVEASFASRNFTLRRKSSVVARVIFDSMLQPAPAGVRSSRHSPRRIVSRVGRWVIDLQLEQTSGKKLIVTGQVINRPWLARAAPALDISLMREQVVLGRSATNQFGEFQVSGESGSDLHLYIDAPGRMAIKVPLPGEEQPSGAC